EQEFRDQLFNEWCLELRTIYQAQAMLKQQAQAQGDGAPGDTLLTAYDLRDVSTRFREVHEFELAQRLVQDANIVQADLELPKDALSYRNDVLYRIAHCNDIGNYFFKLDETMARDALNLFGETLITHVNTSNELQQVIEGSLLIH